MSEEKDLCPCCKLRKPGNSPDRVGMLRLCAICTFNSLDDSYSRGVERILDEKNFIEKEFSYAANLYS